MTEALPYNGRYELRRCVRTARHYTIYHAHDTRSEKDVALLLFSAAVCEKKGFCQALEDNISRAAKLDSPYIARIIAYGEDYFSGSPRCFVVSEASNLSQRKTLEECFISVSKNTELIYEVITKIALALEVGWRGGVSHGCISPQNILCGEDGVKLAYFGVAGALNDAGFALDDGKAFFAPELVPDSFSNHNIFLNRDPEPKHMTHRSDVYSLGALLYWLFTGITYITGERIAIARYRADVDSSVDYILRTALSIDPNNRFESANQLSDALCAVLKPKGGGAVNAAEFSSEKLPKTEVDPLRFHETGLQDDAVQSDKPERAHLAESRNVGFSGEDRYIKADATKLPSSGSVRKKSEDIRRPRETPSAKFDELHSGGFGTASDESGSYEVKSYNVKDEILAMVDLGGMPTKSRKWSKQFLYILCSVGAVGVGVLGGYFAVTYFPKISPNADSSLTAGKIMPNLVGMKREQALEKLNNLDVKFTISTEHSATLPAGYVTGAVPDIGSRIDSNTEVVLMVSDGKLELPNFVGLKYEAARRALDELHLDVKKICTGNTVSAQNPAGGSVIAQGIEIVLETCGGSGRQVTPKSDRAGDRASDRARSVPGEGRPGPDTRGSEAGNSTGGLSPGLGQRNNISPNSGRQTGQAPGQGAATKSGQSDATRSGESNGGAGNGGAGAAEGDTAVNSSEHSEGSESTGGVGGAVTDGNNDAEAGNAGGAVTSGMTGAQPGARDRSDGTRVGQPASTE